jgi:hypothetical protein
MNDGSHPRSAMGTIPIVSGKHPMARLSWKIEAVVIGKMKQRATLQMK